MFCSFSKITNQNIYIKDKSCGKLLSMNELLSPAGSIETFYAAIANGCDAIYLGLDKFSARAYAENFTIDNLKELINFAHLRNVKIYITMNTIIYNNELEEVYKTIDELANINVDALIVQDLAILSYVKNKYKSLEIHASTQMGIDDLDGAKLLKELGVSQIVFARETSLNTLKTIKKSLNIKAETFIHGALCVAYSGNCLMSSMIGDRSGNRGRCAGCCRQIYSLYDKDNSTPIKTGYLLSMKDLNTSEHIKDMSFIDSFKIEGRMKETNYVANVTNTYRKLMDNELSSVESLNKVFNRSYTKGFLLNESSENITNIIKPNNMGYLIGEVVRVDKEAIYIKLFKPLHKGDQICIESSTIGKEISIPILKLFDGAFKACEEANKMAVVFSKEKINIKAKVYITKDIHFIKESDHELLNREYKRLGLNIEFSAKIDKPIFLKISFENYTAYVRSSFLVEKAINSKTTKDNIYTQLNKLNDTPYKIDHITINVDDNIFIPLKSINELRRQAIDELNKKRLKFKVTYNQQKDIIVKKHDLLTPIITVEVSNDEQFALAKKLGIKDIYYKNKIRRNNAQYIPLQGNVLVGGLGGLYHYRNTNEVITDYSLNITNSISCALLSALGADRITLSQEINLESINDLVDEYYKLYNTYPNLELIVYGRATLMHSKYCLLKRLGMCGNCKTHNYYLKDKFADFPLQFNSDCTMSILNSKALNIMDDLDNLKGVNYFRLIFTNESTDEMERIIMSFIDKLEHKSNKYLFNKNENTRGHFIKNPL